jgi:hypothetical protein
VDIISLTPVKKKNDQPAQIFTKLILACKYYIQAKFTLEQAMKAQRGSRGIALLFL